MSETTSGYGIDTVAILAEVARALAEPGRRRTFREDPVGTVEGFDQLPSEVQDMFRSMGEEELAALDRFCDTLSGAGYTVQVRGVSVCMY